MVKGLKSIVNVSLSVVGAGAGIVFITPWLSAGFSATWWEAGIILIATGIGAYIGDLVSDTVVEKD